jgi:hypothetical protein
MFFHTTRRQFHHTTDGVGQIDQDRYLTGIRFESAISKDFGHYHGQDTAQIIIPEDQRFHSVMLRIDTNNCVSVEALCCTDGNVKTKQQIYRSRIEKSFRARFEEMNFSGCQEIEMGLTRVCNTVVFDVLV